MAKKLSPLAEEKLFRRQDVKEIIVQELGLTEENGPRTVRKWIANNRPNGRLTTDAVIKILSKELKLTKSELLIDCENEGPIKKRKGNSVPAISG
jgi:hypothetical protein